ncbi:MAG: 50S ribosomal protein L10 [Fibrobacteres bacterium]|nr:50S ribosomal protein L10 [Fibrobacterota bacterium]
MKPRVVDKDKLISEVNGKLDKAAAVYLLDFLGMTVAEVNEIRSKFKNEGIYYKVIKNTLVKRALNAHNVKGLDSFLKGPTAVAIDFADGVAPAKIILEYSKKHKDNLPGLKAVLLDGRVFNVKEIEAISKLPSKKELIGILAGTLNAPIVKLAGTMQSLVTQILYAVNAVKESKEQK